MLRWLGANETVDLSVGSDALAVRSMMLDYAARSDAAWGGQPWAAASRADSASGTWLASDSSLWSWIAYSLGGKPEWTTVIIPGVYVSPSMVGLFTLEELLISTGPGQTLLPGTQYRAWHDDYPHVAFNPPPSTIYVGPNSPYNQPNLLAPGTPTETTPTTTTAKTLPPTPSTGSRALIAIFAIGVLSLVIFAPDFVAGTQKRRANPGRPPKKWFRDCVKGVRAGGYAYDPAAVCGAQWQRMSAGKRRAAVRREER